MNYVSESVLKGSLTSVLKEIENLADRQKRAVLAVINRKDVFTILPTGHGKLIIFQFELMSGNTCSSQVLHTLIMPQFWLCVL